MTKTTEEEKCLAWVSASKRGDITMSAHTQIGYVSATVKKYEKQNDESTTETGVVVPDQLPTDSGNG
jgi:hypothetical protein